MMLQYKPHYYKMESRVILHMAKMSTVLYKRLNIIMHLDTLSCKGVYYNIITLYRYSHYYVKIVNTGLNVLTGQFSQILVVYVAD